MKGIIKKNQVIITALALMLATAGYLQVTSAKKGADRVLPAGVTPEGEYHISDASLSELYGDISSEDGENLVAVLEENEAAKKAEEMASGEDGSTPVDQPGEAILVSTTIRGDYALNAKLYREQTRAKNKETLMNLLGDVTISEKQKQAAIDALLEMTAVSEKEQAAELLLSAKGFEDAVVNIVGEEVDVVINAESVTDRQIAQIEDIVMRKTGAEAEKIVITAAIQNE